MRWLRFVVLLPSASVALSACGDRSVTGSGDRPSFNVGASAVTIDFTSYGEGKVFQPDFYRSDGIVFPPERCGSAGCDTWIVGFTQGDDALHCEDSRGAGQAAHHATSSVLSQYFEP